jgi:hypothetical protein
MLFEGNTHKYLEAKWWPGGMVHTHNPNYLGGRGRRIVSLKPAWAKLARPYLKGKKKERKAVHMVQVVGSLPSKHSALCLILSNPFPPRKKKQRSNIFNVTSNGLRKKYV